MILTIFVTCPSELGDDYLKLYREALLRWNRSGLADAQIILLPQRKISIDVDPFEVCNIDFEHVGGYPVWDVMRHVRAAWPMVLGEYVSFDHPEFIWGPGRLEKTIEFLKTRRPIYAMGNLRRPGIISGEKAKNFRESESSKAAAIWFRRFMEENSLYYEAAAAFEFLQTTQWMYWLASEQKPGPQPWVEDVFYADKAWLDSFGFVRGDIELPFQDVYDLMQMAARTLFQFGLPFYCFRMTQDVNRLIHLYHQRNYSSWTPEMRDWFFSDPDRWKGTRFLDEEIWQSLIELKSDPKMTDKPVSEFRFGPRGTAINYGVEIAKWLSGDGVDVMRKFYARRAGNGFK